jgi:L-fuculose-phosphate aldolase
MKLQSDFSEQIEEMVEGCHRLATLGYVTSSGGNISYRVEENLVLITPTKTPKRIMRVEDICAVDLEGRIVFSSGGKKPTGEMPFHLRILKARPDLKAVVHAHPPVLTGFAIAGSDLITQPFLPEPITEVGPMLLVPYETPLSEALSMQFDAVIRKSNGFLMENHGAVVCGDGVFEAVEMMQMMECMGVSIMTAHALGKCEPISPAFVKEMDQVIAVRNLRMPGAPGEFASASELYGL